LKKIFHILIVAQIAYSNIGIGQNMVMNPSFEDNDSCPSSSSQINNANGWSSFHNSPDYFNSCATNINFSVPSNVLGYQLASTGFAYSGITTFYTEFSDFREIIGGTLLSTMNIGTKYYFSMKVSLCIDVPTSTSHASNNLGVRFLTETYDNTNPWMIDNFAHIWTDTVITDTASWVTVSGSIIADSAYSNFAIGNLFDDINTDTVQLGNGTTGFTSYYYIDDVCVSLDSSYCINTGNTGLFDSGFRESMVVYPNPTSGSISIDLGMIYEGVVVNLNNILGERLSTSTFKQTDHIEFEIDGDIGFYVMEILTFDNKKATIKLLKE
jgi:hypothetical protein